MVAEKGFHDISLIGLVAPFHHSRVRLGRIDFTFFDSERCEGEGGGAFKVPRHKKTSRRQGRKVIFSSAAGTQVGGKNFSLPARLFLARFTAGLGNGRKPSPICGKRCSCSTFRGNKSFARPLRIGFRKEREIEQPFAGIIDDVDGERSTRWLHAG